MAEFPSLPLFTDAYLADAGHLSDAEHGRYLLILMTMWRAPECRLPNDDEWLSRRFRRSVESVQSELRPIIAEFLQTNGNWLTQKRLRKEWEWCRRYSKNQSDRAKSRWDKEKDTCNGTSAATPSGNAPTLTPNKERIERFKTIGEVNANPRNGWSPPKHGATGKGRVYILSGTSEWEAYAEDFRKAHNGESPLPNDHGGKWFKTTGEASH
jgi:uncharacterized protein YdaU (DUF1376 family)